MKAVHVLVLCLLSAGLLVSCGKPVEETVEVTGDVSGQIVEDTTGADDMEGMMEVEMIDMDEDATMDDMDDMADMDASADMDATVDADASTDVR